VAAPLQVVVIGGGFGGLEVCKALRREQRRGRIQLTLVDKENFFQFNPLLPEVATGAVETRHIVYPLREFCGTRGIRFIRNKVRAVSEATRTLELHNGLSLRYDHLIIAAGASTNWFDIPGAEALSFPFKSLMDAIRLRAHVVEMWELADQAEDPEVRRQLLTFVVAGGGITGVEVCSSLMEMFQRTMVRLYPRVPASLVSVHLIEAGERLLGGLHESHARVAEAHLRRAGVKVFLHRKVASVDRERVTLDDGAAIPAHTLVWTTGIRGPLLDSPWPFPCGRAGRLRVDEHGRVGEAVWAIGDAADWQDESGRSVPQVAQGAFQSARVVAHNLVASLDGRPLRQLRYKDLGYIVGLGRHSTVASVMGIPISGSLAWYFWAFYYLFAMVGFRKQLEVATDVFKGLFVLHDTSQIHERRRMLRDADLDPLLGGEVRPEPHSGSGK
jgi:NADH:ubiquinone reductase (H+-translocating)